MNTVIFINLLLNSISIFLFFLVFILIYAGILLLIVTDDDITNLRKSPVERYYDLCYFLTVSITSVGYGDITPKSTRMKLSMSFLILFIFVLLFTFSFYGIHCKIISNTLSNKKNN